MMNFAFKTRNFVVKNKEFCVKNEEFCITNDEFCSPFHALTAPSRKPSLVTSAIQTRTATHSGPSCFGRWWRRYQRQSPLAAGG